MLDKRHSGIVLVAVSSIGMNQQYVLNEVYLNKNARKKGYVLID